MQQRKISDEQLSALIDGEVDKANISVLLDTILENPEQFKKWQHLQNISDQLQSGTQLSTNMAENVSQYVQTDNRYDVLSKAVKKTPTSLFSHYIINNPLLSMAVAASVVMVFAIYAIDTLLKQPEELFSPQMAQVQTTSTPIHQSQPIKPAQQGVTSLEAIPVYVEYMFPKKNPEVITQFSEYLQLHTDNLINSNYQGQNPEIEMIKYQYDTPLQ